MKHARKLWLVTNTASGNYSADAVEALAEALRDAGFGLDRSVCFPDSDDLPKIVELNEADVGIVAIFSGDGTINAAITRLAGWDGKILILPGGTMNLLSHRLHGDAETGEIVRRVAAGNAYSVRPHLVRSHHGDALVGFSAGPAAAWYNVREAMREADIQQMLDEAGEALRETIQAPTVRLYQPPAGDPEGYPLIEVIPVHQGLRVVAYNARSLGDYVLQGWAMLLRRFREGPHEVLGHFDRLILESAAGQPLNLSIDGETCDGASREELTLARVEVDLLATV